MSYQQDSRLVLNAGAAVGPQIYRILRERIISNDILPGARIVEPQISAEFSVSRQPVREALIKLSVEGLVEVRPQRGTFVRKIAVPEVLDALFVREAIEADIVKELANARLPELAGELRGQLAEQQIAAVNNPRRFMELDERFHRTLAEAAGKIYARNLIESVKAQMDRVRYFFVHRYPMEVFVEQHGAIADAIAAGNAEGAEKAMRAHLRHNLQNLPAIAASNPEFFEPADR